MPNKAINKIIINPNISFDISTYKKLSLSASRLVDDRINFDNTLIISFGKITRNGIFDTITNIITNIKRTVIISSNNKFITILSRLNAPKK